jgi:LmbE family N-acetylglucosaminyl deacetylase
MNGMSLWESGVRDGTEPRFDHFLVRRPHFHLSGSSLLWVGSKQARRSLSEVEIEFWNLLQRPISVKQVQEICGSRADAMICDFLQSELCELVEPSFPSNRRRVLVIEPHADDAVLSIGGTMWLRRFECDFVLATLASRSNHVRYGDPRRDFFDINEVTTIRRSESELFVRLIGGNHISIGMTDAALRYNDSNWTPDFFLRHRMSVLVATSRIAADQERRKWIEAVRQLLIEQPSSEVWFPLGGPHTDHMLAADACCATFRSYPSLVNGRIIRVYQEAPYAARYPGHMNEALGALRNSGAELVEERVSIKGVINQKRRLASIYDSQDIDEMRPDTEASELTHGSSVGASEMFWTLKTLPRRIDPAGIVSAAIIGHSQDEEIAAWVSRNKGTEVLRVLLPMPTGRWVEDLELLFTAFPRAKFEVYATPSATAEVTNVLSDRVKVREIASGALTWFLLTVQFSLSRTSPPTLFHAGHRRIRQAHFLSRLWRGIDTMIVASMDPLASALRGHVNNE